MKAEESNGPVRLLPRITARTHCCSLLQGRLQKDWVWGEDKELRSGDVTPERPAGYPVELLDRELDTEMWDSCRRYVFGSFQNIDDL